MSHEKECEYPNSYFREIKRKSYHQVAGQFHRPEEFLESLVDMIRVTFQTKMLGTLLLNSNPCFLYDAIPKEPFTLGYISEVSRPGETFEDFWGNTLVKKLAKNNYSLKCTSTLFVSIATGQDRMSADLLNDLPHELRGGSDPDDILHHVAKEIRGEEFLLQADIHRGYVCDKNLHDRLRVSLWLILQEKKLQIVK